MDSPRPLWKRVHWMVYALLAPLVLMGMYRLLVGGGRRVQVVGSGVLAELEEADAPEGTRYALDVVPNEAPADTERRLMSTISSWPDVLVFAFRDADSETQAAYERVATAAENATAVPIVVGFSDSPEWFDTFCDGTSLRLCVEPGDDVAAAIAGAVEEAWQRRRRLEASTQVGR